MASLMEYEASRIRHGCSGRRHMGYMNGQWNSAKARARISPPAAESSIVGLDSLDLAKEGQRALSLATTLFCKNTAQALVSHWKDDKGRLYSTLAREYVDGCKDMRERAPGATTMDSVSILDPDSLRGFLILFNSCGGGCGRPCGSPRLNWCSRRASSWRNSCHDKNGPDKNGPPDILIRIRDPTSKVLYRV